MPEDFHRPPNVGKIFELNSSPFGRTATVVRQRGDVTDEGDVDPGVGDGADGGLTASTGTFDKHFHRLETAIMAIFEVLTMMSND